MWLVFYYCWTAGLWLTVISERKGSGYLRTGDLCWKALCTLPITVQVTLDHLLFHWFHKGSQGMVLAEGSGGAKARATNPEGFCRVGGVWMKTLPFIVILALDFPNSLKEMRECALLRKLKYVGEKLSLFHQEPEKALLIFKRINTHQDGSRWDRRHTLSKCDFLTGCLFHSISDSFHHLKPGDSGPHRVLLVSALSFLKQSDHLTLFLKWYSHF